MLEWLGDLFGLLWGAVVLVLSVDFLSDLLLLSVLYVVGRYVYVAFRGNIQSGKPARSFKLSSEEFGAGKELDAINPATNEKITTVRAFTPDEVNECVRRARVAQAEWAETSFDERRAVLQDLMHAVVEQQDTICHLSMQDTGKTRMEAEYGEILTTCEKIRHLIRNGEDALKSESRGVPLLLFLKKAWVEYYPMGVIGIIVPWNYPFHNVASAAVAALFAGNSAVIKVSECSLSSKDYFEKLFRKVLAARGHNPELVTLIVGEGETGAALVKSGVDKILFIGSPAVGKRVMEGASANLTPVILELGGKDPFIVLEDADLDHATEVALRGVFVNCGQNCIAAERIYVHNKILPKFEEVVAKKVAAFRQGASVNGGCFDVGSMTMPRQLEIVDELVQAAIQDGAKVLAGAKRDEKPGLFYRPTVLSNVNHSMRIVNEEVFGPVMLIIPFSSDDEAVRLANSTEYALGSSIFSGNAARAHEVARRVVAGMATINDFGVGYLIQSLPFGGTKISGFGRFGGAEGLREFSRQKSVVTDRFPGVLTKAPAFTKYPIPENGPAIVKNAIHFFYGPESPSGLWAKATHLCAMLQLLITLK
ncbi:aldehyde dehydrogenase [Acanthamoeba castellanii str. Neff]|uniref:Aldehyde dehydrogenase n=1 Tax=Acanthamoeba castellanii (strain ATCC 30010 / Neff) TaxID=1257118 RepID=L8HGQ9_ACACF|nr:aldehyde dehydrogenase [Acanthamoeba castellanii str. Neff]ELR24739.1 aldehyde dehydrogenase [Acanthamoeba castellanii str. Neff]